MNDIEWKISNDVVPYQYAVDFMEKRVAQIYEGSAKQLVWLLEHHPFTHLVQVQMKQMLSAIMVLK